MPPRRPARTQTCTSAQARVRLSSAEKFLEVAKLVDGEDDDDAVRSVVASLAVLAGIAASDAACCLALGQRSRAQNHHEAEGLLAGIANGGAEAATSLRRLLDLKDKAQYGFIHASQDDLKVSISQADESPRVLRRLDRLSQAAS